ncbi:hypothetical protein JXQ70_16610 [bacterium]|nr:hypothetical protein [bacterium]
MNKPVHHGLLLFCCFLIVNSPPFSLADQQEPTPTGFVDRDQDGINDLFRDADGDGLNDLNGQVYNLSVTFVDQDGDGKNDYFQDANGDGLNDLYQQLVNDEIPDPLFALDANQDGHNDITNELITKQFQQFKKNRHAKTDRFIDEDNDGLDDRRAWHQHRGGRNWGGKGRGKGGALTPGRSGNQKTGGQRRQSSSKNSAPALNQTGQYQISASNKTTLLGPIASLARTSSPNRTELEIQLIISTNDGPSRVILGPEWFLARLNLPLNAGTPVTINGWTSVVEGQSVLIASHMTVADRNIILRNEDGSLAY